MGRLRVAKRKGRINKHTLTVLLVAVVLLASAGAGFLMWLLQNNTKQQVVIQPDKPLPKQITDAQDLALSGKADQANQSLQDQIKQPGASDDAKYNALLQLGVNYGNANQHQQALDALKQADAIKSTFTTSHLIAEQYAALGDAQSAVTYYKKTITQLDKNNVNYNFNKQEYEAAIKDLGSQP